MGTRKKFSAADQELRRANPYTEKVTENQISFTLAFKEAFWRLSVEGCTGNMALRTLGYDPELLGFERIHNITKRIRRAGKSPEGIQPAPKSRMRISREQFGAAELEKMSRRESERRMQKAIRTNNTAENLVKREFEMHGPRSVLLTDITYIPLNGAFCYLSTILDGCTKQVLSYVLSESLEVDFVLETVQKMVHQHGISLKKETILHSDQGCHYTCIKFIQLVKNSSLRQSMSRKGNCWDNAPQESFFGHMKDELAEKIPNWTCFADVQRSIDDWMDYYNNDRYQWDLAKLSPNEYYRYLTTGSYPC